MRHLPVLLLAAALAACVQDGGPPRPVTALLPARTPAAASRDDDVKAAAERRLAALDRRAFRAVQVEVRHGRLLLMGAVVKPEHRRKAEQAARGDGAAEVLNELVLAEDKALDLFVPDQAKAEAVRHALGLQDDGVAVRVVNGVAFLLGAAAPDLAARMKADALDVDGIKWVVGHLKAE